MRRLNPFAAVLVLAGCGTTTTITTSVPAAPPVSLAATAPGGACHTHGVLPDPLCTPGATNPQVTQVTIGKTICVRGWTATVRPPQSVTGPIKVRVEKDYGIGPPHPHPFAQEELDHLIPLELGGSPASARNLWPEAAPGYHAKDLTENRLKAAVCAGKLKLADAQRAIASNWQTAP